MRLGEEQGLIWRELRKQKGFYMETSIMVGFSIDILLRGEEGRIGI